MGKYLLGIDNGNTFSKAALFDIEGKEIAVANCAAETEYPHPGWTERDMEMLWQSTATAVREVLAKSSVRPEDIAGIGNTRGLSPPVMSASVSAKALIWAA